MLSIRNAVLVLTSSGLGTFCGNSSWSAPILNSHFLDIYCEGGSDMLIGGLDTFVIGGSGNDSLSGHSGGVITGNDGRDCLMSGTSRDRLSGGNDDDTLCANNPSNSVSTMFGGDGIDSSCGSASIIDNVENNDGCINCFLNCSGLF